MPYMSHQYYRKGYRIRTNVFVLAPGTDIVSVNPLVSGKAMFGYVARVGEKEVEQYFFI